ncbi:MAG TPA: methylenetetrahydrofolate reductase [Anaerolineales bacterium]|nr:methylenetetrahydrofolate reductase [Anaerolineales bacterium]
MTASKTNGRFEAALRSGKFVVTAEVTPPDSADPQDVVKAASTLGRYADALNVTDGSGANCHISSVAACAILSQAGYEVIFQMSCRDRNRIAMQAELLGASALGLHNVLCLTGDDVTVGDHPQAKRVFDIDSIQLLQTARIMRDNGIFLSGRKLLAKPKFFLGGADNPFVEPFDSRPLRLAKKIEAGAEFFQTQYCFDIERLKSHMQKVRDLGLHEINFILIGVGPLRSEKTAEFLRTKVPGVVVPDAVVERMRKAQDKRTEGKKICVEIIQQVREIQGVAGIHIMAYKQEQAGLEILEETGLLLSEKV